MKFNVCVCVCIETYDKDNDDLANDNEMSEDQKLTEDMPFIAVHDRFAMRAGNKPLIDAFFKEEAKDVDDFYNMSDDDNRSCTTLKNE